MVKMIMKDFIVKLCYGLDKRLHFPVGGKRNDDDGLDRDLGEARFTQTTNFHSCRQWKLCFLIHKS